MRAKRLDANHTQIANDLRKIGVNVADLSGNGSGCPDLLVHHYIASVLIELKHGKDAKLKRSQIKFMGNWRGFVGIARNFEEAKQLAFEPGKYCLTAKQKEKLLIYERTMTEAQVHLPTILKVINANKADITIE